LNDSQFHDDATSDLQSTGQTKSFTIYDMTTSDSQRALQI